MKKIIILIFFVVFLSISLLIFKQNEKEIVIKNIDPYSIYPFYKSKLRDEYIAYQEKTGYSIRQSIINVNIGLNKPFYIDTHESQRKNTFEILVNKYNYLKENYFPNDLVDVDKYSNGNIALNKIARDAFYEMAEAIQKEGMHIRIISGYRSFAYQERLYNNYLKSDSQEEVDLYSAKPGYSEHHTGLAIDIDNGVIDYNRFHVTKEYDWMQKNAHKYGYILRYPLGKEKITGYKYEPWHYRYVGKDIARYIHDNDITFEEYYYEFIDIK